MLACKTHSQADVFVGTSAGSPLYHDIREATRSVKVVSPYLGAHLAEVLLACQGRGVAVTAIVTNDGRNAADLARLLVAQEVLPDARRRKLAQTGSLLGWAALLIGCFLLGSTFFRPSIAASAAGGLLLYLGAVLLACCSQLGLFHYRYSYRLAGLRVVPSPRSYPPAARPTAPPFVHAKLYVIDDRVAYLGSANFTTSGLFDHLEAMVRLTSPDAVADLGRHVDELFARGPFPAYPPEVWARPFFREPRAIRPARPARPAETALSGASSPTWTSP